MKDFGHEFPLRDDILYFNHAAVSPWPRRTEEAVANFARECATLGASRYPQWLDTEAHLRAQLAELIGAPSSGDIALLKNTSEGISVVAHGLDWQAGDRVVISNQEFPSNRIPWESLRDRGVEVVEADIGVADPEAAVIECLTEKTRVLAISSVQYGTGLRMDLTRLGNACHERGILFCVDAIQSLGVVPMDVESIGADFVIADGHKWMLGPEGLALFYSRPEAREKLQLHQYGWHMVADAGNYDRRDWEPAADARRFECGSPNLVCAHALSASLSLLLEIGLENVARLVSEKIAWLEAELASGGDFEQITPGDPNRRAGIFTFRPRHGNMDELYQWLWDSGVVCARRGGGIRLSPHFYTPQPVMERVLKILLG